MSFTSSSSSYSCAVIRLGVQALEVRYHGTVTKGKIYGFLRFQNATAWLQNVRFCRIRVPSSIVTTSFFTEIDRYDVKDENERYDVRDENERENERQKGRQRERR